MEKEQILEQLKNDTYTRLGVSTIGGVGVFAIKRIPKGKDPFNGCMPNSIFVDIPEAEIDELDEPLKKLVTDFAPLQNGVYWCPSVGFKAIDQSYHLNNSDNPNMITEDAGENFITSRVIEVGEELLVAYDTYDETVLKEDWYKKKKITEIHAGEGKTIHRVEN